MMWDPKKRPTAAQALKYPYFQVGQNLVRQSKPVMTENKPPKQTYQQPQEKASAKRGFEDASLSSGKSQHVAKAPLQNYNSGRKRWGGNVGVKDSTDEFESILNEIEDSNLSGIHRKVGYICLSVFFNQCVLNISLSAKKLSLIGYAYFLLLRDQSFFAGVGVSANRRGPAFVMSHKGWGFDKDKGHFAQISASENRAAPCKY